MDKADGVNQVADDDPITTHTVDWFTVLKAKARRRTSLAATESVDDLSLTSFDYQIPQVGLLIRARFSSLLAPAQVDDDRLSRHASLVVTL